MVILQTDHAHEIHFTAFPKILGDNLPDIKVNLILWNNERVSIKPIYGRPWWFHLCMIQLWLNREEWQRRNSMSDVSFTGTRHMINHHSRYLVRVRELFLLTFTNSASSNSSLWIRSTETDIPLRFNHHLMLWLIAILINSPVNLQAVQV